MKNLTMTVRETNNKAGKFTYQVEEDGKVLAQRKSNRVYVVCIVEVFDKTWDDHKKEYVDAEPTYKLTVFSSDPTRLKPNRHSNVYAIATIKQ